MTSVIGSGPREARAQRLALDEGHHIEGQPVRLAGAEHRDDVILLKCRRRLDLALEAFNADPLRQLGGEHLHHNLPLEAVLFGHEDSAHPPATELALECIGTAERLLQLLADLLGHPMWQRGAGAHEIM